jgi:hypothetical protein
MRTAGSPPLVRRESVAVGALGMAAAVAVMGVNLATHGQGWFFRNDAEFFWVVARDPWGRGQMFRPVAAVTGNAYRFGRPLFPVMAWALALGRPGAVRWTMMAVDALAFGTMVGLAGELLARRGKPAINAIAILVLPSVWWAVILTISEPVVLSLILLVFLLHLAGRRNAVLVTAAFLLLARESAGLALVPLVVDDLRRRGWRSAGPWAITAVPLLAWWTWVRVRVGEWPFLDRSESRRLALDLPLRGYFHVRGGVHAGHIVAFALVAMTVSVSVWAWRARPWPPVSGAAALFGLLLLVLGPNATRFPGEVLRLMMPAQVLVAIVLLGWAPPVKEAAARE